MAKSASHSEHRSYWQKLWTRELSIVLWHAEVDVDLGSSSRVASTIPSNVAEGFSRHSRKVYRLHIAIALGSTGRGRDAARARTTTLVPCEAKSWMICSNDAQPVAQHRSRPLALPTPETIAVILSACESVPASRAKLVPNA